MYVLPGVLASQRPGLTVNSQVELLGARARDVAVSRVLLPPDSVSSRDRDEA
jgi:hypothetical protein